MKNLIFLVWAAVVTAGVGYADQAEGRITVKIDKTPAYSGKLMYANYCAPCHGIDGKGNGPVALVLKKQPADLSGLSRNNRGKFPTEHVMAVIQFGAANSAHGVAEMPVWGPILSEMDPAYAGQLRGTLRIINLNQFIESLQAK
jgi:mono/diheme cytochrome c family protein